MTGNISFWFEVGVAISGLLGGAFAGVFYTRASFKAQEKRAVEEASISPKNSSFQNRHTAVHETLTALRIKTGADRARVGHFHNGGKFLDGTPMKKFSMTHESCDRGIPYDGANLQNILVTMFWELVETMRENDTVIRWVKNMKEGYFRSYNNANGISAYAVLPIMKNDLFIGFIVVEWFDAERVPSDGKAFAKTFSQAKDYIELELALR